MTSEVPPAIPSGGLSCAAQPALPSRDGALLLRPWQSADAPVLQAAFQDPLIRYWHRGHVDSTREAREWIAGCGRDWQREHAAQWAISRTSGGEVLGRVALRSIDLEQGGAECAYWVLPDARGAGVAPRALAALAKWALEKAGFHRLILEHSVDNTASCRVAAKTGFALEGTLREAHLHTDGWHDVHLHARLHGDTGHPPDVRTQTRGARECE